MHVQYFCNIYKRSNLKYNARVTIIYDYYVCNFIQNVHEKPPKAEAETNRTSLH
jgi:hypothetical protein